MSSLVENNDLKIIFLYGAEIDRDQFVNFTGRVEDIYLGERRWYVNGRLHREDGPAYERFGKLPEAIFYLHGFSYPLEVWFEKLSPAQKEKAIWNVDLW